VNPSEAKCLVISKVLVADGMMTDEEREFLREIMQVQGLTEDERRRVIELEGMDEADVVVQALPEEERRDIVAMLIDASSADGKLSPHELETVKRLTTALGL
jgi:uncharacterized tellurite resistance protein B-like protein